MWSLADAPLEGVGVVEDERGFGSDVSDSTDDGEDGISVTFEGSGKARADDAFLDPGFVFAELLILGEAGEFSTGACAAGGAIVGFARAENEVAGIGGGRYGSAEEFDVIDFAPVGPRDVLLIECLSHAPGVVGERVEVAKLKIESVVLDQEEPVSPPGDIPANESKAWDLDRNGFRVTIARDVGERDTTVCVESCGDDSDGGFDPMITRHDAFEVSERGDETDGSVAAHAEEPHIIKEDDTGNAGGVGWGNQDRADEHIGAARFIDGGGAEVVEARPEDGELLGGVAGPEVGSAGDDDARGFAAGVGVDDGDAVRHGRPQSSQGVGLM